ncbi:leucine-rich repeat-containing G-protein coupled receptor 4-like [Pecten maximus]|uniref:leucine-rich repeat-containing G-protein coupled receptor 4-like n=1 Tax=Pecten maximus TaxID=6579 RepID=UPI0014587074|nr:leucine-rich repeat-containing G-protein coupled receptor 4-like [Pecten maximus]
MPQSCKYFQIDYHNVKVRFTEKDKEYVYSSYSNVKVRFTEKDKEYVYSSYSNVKLMLTIVTQGYSASVPDDPHPCPVKAPCSCDFNKVECNNLTQTEFPTFTKVNATWHCWTLVMNYNNNIKRIPAGAFDNLPFCSLQIGHNGFEIMEDGALTGSEPYLDSVFMQFNKFKELPNEIARMPNITMMSIHDNPITTLPREMAFASTLQFLDIGSPEMTTWPDSIQTLKTVWSLSIYKLPMSDLPIDAFVGLEDSIGFVTFSATKFKGIPKAMRRLRKMTDLLIEDNVELTSDGIPDDAFSGMVSLRDIAITNSSLTRVPNLATIPALTHLELSNSPLSQWDLATLPDQPIIQSVDFSYTNIDSIPVAVRHTRSLFELSLDNTKVSNIGPNDLTGLQKLQQLSLDHAPLTDISMDAFNDTHLLQGLNLDSTKLPGFPRAIERLPALRFVSLQNISIECSCAELGWMKTWIGFKQFLGGDGKCHNIHMDFIEYIRNEIPKCP